MYAYHIRELQREESEKTTFVAIREQEMEGAP